MIARKKDAHKEMCKSRTEANKARYKNMKNRAKKVVTKAMKEAAERELRELSEHPNKVFKLVKSCLLYTSPSPRDGLLSRMPSSA